MCLWSKTRLFTAAFYIEAERFADLPKRSQSRQEVNYWLFPHEIKKVVPQVEKLWLAPGKLIFPDVMLKCESGLCLHWDKHATEWPDINWDGDIPVLEEPDFVKKVYNIA